MAFEDDWDELDVDVEVRDLFDWAGALAGALAPEEPPSEVEWDELLEEPDDREDRGVRILRGEEVAGAEVFFVRFLGFTRAWVSVEGRVDSATRDGWSSIDVRSAPPELRAFSVEGPGFGDVRSGLGAGFVVI